MQEKYDGNYEGMNNKFNMNILTFMLNAQKNSYGCC